MQHRKVFKYRIYKVYPIIMKKVSLQVRRRLVIEGIAGFLIRKVTPFGNSAKVDCPKEYLGKTVYLVIVEK